jgi:hypothetical protein
MELTFNKFPHNLTGDIKLNTVANFAKGDTVTGGTSGATGKVIKVFTTGTKLRVNSITGMFSPGETVTNTGTGTGVVAANGWDLSVTGTGLMRTLRSGAGRVRTELLWFLKNLNTKRADAVVLPTFSAAVGYSGTAAMVTGDVLTITVTASEPVHVKASSFIAVDIDTDTVSAMYDGATSTSTSLKFKYTIEASDLATAGQVIVDTTITGVVADILGGGSLQPAAVTFVAPNTSTATVN